jgi:hypothetical protein
MFNSSDVNSISFQIWYSSTPALSNWMKRGLKKVGNGNESSIPKCFSSLFCCSNFSELLLLMKKNVTYYT